MKLIEQIKAYQPYNDQEKEDKIEILNHLKNNPSCFNRDSRMAHMTASAWVVNKSRTKVLMVYHNLYDSWSWLGGHADDDQDLCHVAIKEVKEESGLKEVTLLDSNLFSLEILTVDGHMKRGIYVPSHLHLNVTYLLEANDEHALQHQPDENSDVNWFLIDDAVQASSEPWFRDNVYSKLNEKLKIYINKSSRS